MTRRSALLPPLLLAAALIVVPLPLGAAEGAKGPSEVVFLAEIIALLVAGRLMGELMVRIGQPAVMGQLIAGILLGPSALGALAPDLQHMLFPRTPEQKAMIDAVSQLGIFMLLLLTGMETDLSVVRQARRAAFSVSLTGIAMPFACGFVVGEFLPESLLPHPEMRFITSLFLGTALSISSVKIVAMVVREMNFLRRTVGQVIVASAIIDDTVGWIIMSVTFGLAAHGGIDLASVGQSVLGTIAFLAFSFTIGRRIVFFVIRWTNDHFVSEMPVITAILVLAGVMALITQAIGVHTVLGAFVSGILIGQSPILTRHIDEELRGLIVALFMPVFFGMAGLGTDLKVLADPSLALLSLGFIAIASVGKFTGAFLGGELGGLSRREALAIGCGMNARGSTEVIVATIGLSMGALSQNLFTIIVAMAVVTTMAMPPMLRWALARLPMREEEKRRLEREAFEQESFVAKLERLLVVVDDSPSGSLASRLTGLLAGARRLPTTVLHVEAQTAPEAERAEKVRELVVATAEATETDLGVDEDSPVAVEAATPEENAAIEETVAREAKKGFDILIAGIEPVADEGEFDRRLTRIIGNFDGPFAIAAGREAEPGERLDILVPVTGTGFSRHGAEIALVLAQATGGTVTALHVSQARRTWRRRVRAALAGRNELAILREVVRLGEQFGVKVRTARGERGAPENAIVREVRRGQYDLVVMGVSPRPGETLFFGNVPGAVVEQSERPVLLVAS